MRRILNAKKCRHLVRSAVWGWSVSRVDANVSDTDTHNVRAHLKRPVSEAVSIDTAVTIMENVRKIPYEKVI